MDISKKEKTKKTGEVTRDYIIQIQQKESLNDGGIKLIPLNVPVDESLSKNYNDKKYGDTVKIPCNVYGENFAEIKISKNEKLIYNV